MFFSRLKYLLPRYRRAQERDMQEELAALEQIASRRELGNLTAAAEDARAVLGFPILHGAGTDIRYGLRALRRDRGFTLVAVTSLSLGIAANVSVFGLMDTLLWRELPVRDPDQLVSFRNTSKSYFGYSEFAKHSGDALQEVMAQSATLDASIDLGSGPAHAEIQFVSGNYFGALGVTPVYGRLILTSNDDPQHPAQVVTLSYGYWRKAFNGDPSVIGRSFHLGEGHFEIIGIAPKEFFGLSVGEAPDVFLPIAAQPAVFSGNNWLSGRNTNWLNIFGRLRRDMTIRRAQSILTPVSLEIDIERNGHVPTPAERKQMLQDPIRLEPAARGISDLRDRFSRPLHVVFGMLVVGLFLACINVVSLQIARADERQKEFAVRLAIGASRFRIVRQCFVETLLLAAVSALMGSLLFRPAASAVVSLMTMWGGEPARLNLTLHAEMLAFVILLCLAVALISGLLPAIYSGRKEIQPGLQRGPLAAAAPRHHRGVVRAVGIVQLAVSLVMITGTCLFVFSLHELQHFDAGVRRDGLLEIEIDPMRAGYQDLRAVLLDERLRDRFAAMSAIEHVTFSQNGIYSGRNFEGGFEADGFHPADRDANHGIYDYVGPNFFTTLGTTILAGRDFSERDNAAAPKVIIVNRAFADRVFPNQDAVGRNVYFADQTGKKAHRIIGVVRDVRTDIREARLMWYLPALQHDMHVFTTRFLIRTTNRRTATFSDLRAAVHAEDSRLRIDKFETADRLLDRTLGTDRLMARLGWAFGILALILASAGIYGLLSYDVTRRTGEIGIRTALGAFRTDIMKLVMAEVLVITSFGLALGGVAAMLLTKLVRSLVFGIGVNDPRVELAAAAILVVVALVAAVIPARRAVRIDPMNALRAE